MNLKTINLNLSVCTGSRIAGSYNLLKGVSIVCDGRQMRKKKIIFKVNPEKLSYWIMKRLLASHLNLLFPIPVNIGEMNSGQRKWITDHILYPYVKSKKFDFDGFTKKMLKLSDPFWSKAFELIPDIWKTEQFDIIKDRITSFINNRTQFIKELKINMS